MPGNDQVNAASLVVTIIVELKEKINILRISRNFWEVASSRALRSSPGPSSKVFCG